MRRPQTPSSVSPSSNSHFAHIDSMAPRSFLVLSDIHFGTMAEHPEFSLVGSKNRGLSKPEPLVAGMVSKIQSKGIQLDGIVVPGDLTSTAEPAEFSQCFAVLAKIAEALGVSKDRIYVTFGNHDTNWKIAKLGKSPSKPMAAHGETSNDSTTQTDDPLYNEIAAQVGPLFFPVASHFSSGPTPGSGVFHGPDFDIIALNSGYYCTPDIRHGSIGTKQLEWLSSLPPLTGEKWRILIVHHHPSNLPYPRPLPDYSTLQEGAEIQREIARLGIDFVIHGHRHHPIIHSVLEHGWTNAVTFLCAGSAGAGAHHRDAGNIPNTVHVVSLNGRSPTGQATGKVYTFGYRNGTGWFEPHNCKETPLDPVKHFGVCLDAVSVQATISALLQELRQGQPGDRINLPEYEDLPIEVKCSDLATLNKFFIESAWSMQLKIIGAYPATVVALRS